MKRQRYPKAIFLFLISIMFGVMVLGNVLWAEDFGGDVSIDSKIELKEVAEGGVYRTYSITLTTLANQSTVALAKDGSQSGGGMPFEECREVWDYLLARDVWNLPDGMQSNPSPGQSSYTLTLSNGVKAHTIAMYGVDFLPDTRYREIVRKIMAVAGQH